MVANATQRERVVQPASCPCLSRSEYGYACGDAGQTASRLYRSNKQDAEHQQHPWRNSAPADPWSQWRNESCAPMSRTMLPGEQEDENEAI